MLHESLIRATVGGDLGKIEQVRDLLHRLSAQQGEPVDRVRWVPLDQVEPNDYNPNSVKKAELGLLAHSIRHDGYTQPVVTIYDPKKGKYVIVDGFHRYYVMQASPDIREACGGMLPVVVIDKPIKDRMASTVRHNRARGKHTVTGMATMVRKLIAEGWEEDAICNELGLKSDELVRLRYERGYARLYASHEYGNAWVMRRQVKAGKQYREDHDGE